MAIKRQIGFLTLAAGISCLLYAQPQPVSLNLEDARALALKNHPQVLASQASYLREDQITREVKSAYYPTLNGAITGAQADE